MLRATDRAVAAIGFHRKPHDVHTGAACLTLIFSLGISALHAAALSPSDAPATVQQAQDQAAWASQEAEGRATEGDYEGAVQAQDEADQDLSVAQRLRQAQPTVR